MGRERVLNIILACNAGMSTSILCRRMKDEAARRGLDVTIEAVPVSDLEDCAATADIILLGPQVRYAEKSVRGYAKCPVEVLEMKEYGSMNGGAILDKVQKALG